MHFSRVRVHPDRLDPDKLAAVLTGGGYSLHQLLWELFPGEPDADRDFIYRRESENGWPMFYLVSDRAPLGVPGLFEVETKPYSPRLSSGQRLSFSLRVNPVVTRKNDSGGRSRHDVVMDAKRQNRDRGEEIPTPDVITREGTRWLIGRAKKAGFEVDSRLIRVEGYLQHRIAKPGTRKPIRFSTLDFSGILTVRHPEPFTRMLFNGLGPAKAFGCGLMLIRKI